MINVIPRGVIPLYREGSVFRTSHSRCVTMFAFSKYDKYLSLNASETKISTVKVTDGFKGEGLKEIDRFKGTEGFEEGRKV